MNTLWWQITQHFKFKRGKIWAYVVSFALGSATLAVLLVLFQHFSGESLKLASHGLLSIFAGLAVSLLTEFKMEHVQYRPLAALVGTLVCALIIAVGAFYMFAALRIENATVQTFIIGIFFPGCEVCMKLLYRKQVASNQKVSDDESDDVASIDREIKNQAFVYVARNLELFLGKTNLVLMFLIPQLHLFFAALCLSFVAEICGLLFSNARFSKPAKLLQKQGSKILPSLLTQKYEDRTKSTIVRMGMERARENKAKAKLAILRCCEEISEKINIITAAVTVYFLLGMGIVEAHSVTVIEDLAVRVAGAITIETIVDCVKVVIDSFWGIYDYMVKNDMDRYDICNIAFAEVIANGLLGISISFVMSIK